MKILNRQGVFDTTRGGWKIAGTAFLAVCLVATNAYGKKGGGGKHVDVFHIPKSGAGQIALIGMPNSGKSSIVGALSNAKVNIADYPFATSLPVPGMAHFEDVAVQVVDTPPVTADYAAPGQVNTYRGCDFIGIVIDFESG